MGVALITPFHSDGSIDFDKLSQLVENQIDSGTDYIVALGTTAETPALTPDERKEVKQCVVRQISGRLPLVVGCGGNCTAEVVGEISRSDFSGVDALLSVAPFYNKPSQQGLYAHFRAVAEASPVPVVLYNIPGRTGVNMLPDTTLRLASDCPNIIGIKEASGIMGQFNRLVCDAPDGFDIICGDDAIALPTISIGGSGVISVIGNAYPAEFASMVNLALEGRIEDARALHRRFTPLYPLLFAEGNPAGIKCLMSLMGLIDETLRLPLMPVSDALRTRITAQIDKIEA